MICLCGCSVVSYSQANTTNKGTEFWTAWMDHVGPPVGPVIGREPRSQMVLYITSDLSTTGTVSLADGSFSEPFTVTANQVSFVDIPASAFLGRQGIYNTGIHITSAKPVVVYAHIYAESVSGATLVLPVAALAKDYYSINYTQQSNNSNSYSAFDIIATEDNTTVEITSAAQLLDGKAAGAAFTVVLNKGQIYQGLSSTDLTGTRIRSVSNSDGGCKKIAVYSGSSKVYIGCPRVSSDNLFQQVYPTGSWGKNYVTVPLAGRSYDVYRIIYSDPAAQVTINGVPVTAGQLVNNFYYEFTASEPKVIKSDKAIQVVQYAVTQNNTLNCVANNESAGDPEMIFLTPIEQGLDKVTLYSTNRYEILYNYINIIIPAPAVPSFTLDGAAYTSFKSIPNNTAYSYAQISVGAGPHTIAASDNFNAIAYGFGSLESYGYAAGTNLQDLNQYIVLADSVRNVTQTSGCANQSYDLKVTIPFQTTSIKWNLNNGSAMFTDHNPKIINQSPSKDGTQTLYTYRYPNGIAFTPGDHTVIASVFNPVADECGSYTDVEFDFSIAEPPAAAFGLSKISCLGDSSVFADKSAITSGTITSWLWDFGDTQTSVLQNPSHLYARAGDYKVTLTITSSSGCTSIAPPQTVHIGLLPVAGFSISAPDCANKGVTFTSTSATPEGKLTQWIWDFGDASPIDTVTIGAPLIHTYSVAGTYIAKLQVVNSSGCISNSVAQNVIINPLPVAKFVLPDVCLSDAYAQFTDSSSVAGGTSGDLIYLWNFGDPNATASNPNTSAQQNPRHKYSQARGAANPYQVSLTVTSKTGCVSVTAVQNFTVNGSMPVAGFKVENRDALCSSNAVIFSNTSTVDVGSIIKMVWYFDLDNHPSDTVVYYKNRGQLPADNKFSHNYGSFSAPLSKNYHVRLIVYSGVTCLQQFDDHITVNANPKISIISPGVVCQNTGSVQISENRNGFPGTGAFSGTGVTTSGIFNPEGVAAGIYLLSYHFVAANTCGYDTVIQVMVSPAPAVKAARTQNILSGGSVILDATAIISDGSKLTYKWTPSAGLDHDDVLNPIASPVTDTKYILQVFTPSGCFAGADVQVSVLQAPVIPNTFTPNGDGINDNWNIQYLDSYKHSIIEIFNRYGEKVYSSVGYPVPWDGRYKGADLPAGTYYYIINPQNGRKAISGYVVIIR